MNKKRLIIIGSIIAVVVILIVSVVGVLAAFTLPASININTIAINKIDTSSIPHSPDCVLDKYICESYDNLAQELNPSNTVIWLNSVYSSFPVFGNYQYYNEDGEWTGDMLTVSLTSGDTHQDALNEVYNELNNKLSNK